MKMSPLQRKNKIRQNKNVPVSKQKKNFGKIKELAFQNKNSRLQSKKIPDEIKKKLGKMKISLLPGKEKPLAK